ncbi:isochorismate synthase [Natronolimnobius baerhuensis]|uniref:isochorismate synthase n=1 Tax=Natronolimnobius baerhuensis TaxID=253108 RepID=A0A202EDF5_9EURY|nr:isochorismate synthase [Natronolimnobius baerhuensis]OVE86303.1 isochorismate synthase [Natronolimnobius baerhuensis]
MDGTSEGRLAGTPHEPASETLEEPLVSASRELADVSFGAITDAEFDGDEASELRLQWATPDGLEIVGRGVAARLTATGPTRFDDIHQQASNLFADLEHDGPAIARPRAFGGFAFHDSHDTVAEYDETATSDTADTADTDARNSHWQGFDAASFVVPRVFVTRSDTDDLTGNAKIWLTAVGTDASETSDRLERWDERLADLPAMQPSGTSPGVAATERTTTREQWAGQVDAALERIATDRLRKVVLAQALSVDLEDEIDVASTLERLRRRYPNCYRFLISGHDGSTFFGAPPERLVSKRGDRVETEALAGSAPRGEAPEEDEAYADEMLASDKLDREHDLVVEAIRDQLEGLASELYIGDRGIRKLATIQHLQTPIEATLAADRHVLELVEGLHPTPAVGGMPPEAAWETIRDTEPFDRGWYASPIGWFDANGDGEFAVGLRSGVATADRVTLFAGNGIVADSDPDEEWEEVQLKFRPILDELR